tara:strand:+ start:31 stop:276 length:246 start_codon:yes stop_codon:yes gene_type:complete
MAYEKNKKSTATLQQMGKDNFKKFDKKSKKKTKKTKKRKITSMKEHEKHHSKKHITLMKRFMSGGMSMDRAHSLAIKMVGK